MRAVSSVEGQNLTELVAQHPLPPRKAARYVKLIAGAIHYAHGQGILHRDLKPSNVLIDSATDQPRVTDFGLAKRLDGESSLTVTGQVLGSPHFMPPEQAGSKRGKVSRASDVFGLGGILYFLLTARAPFQGETIEATIQQVLHTEPVSPRLLNATVPLDLETICLKCLEKEPSHRYQMAGEVVEELERFLRDEPILARPLSRVERTWRWCRRKPAVAALAAATILLLLAVAIGSPIAAWRIAAARDAERLERQRAQGNANELVKSLYVADMRTAWQAVQDDNLLLARESVYKYLPALGIPVSA
ncbi:MAG TPA: serine/threonine-protein kinase, partial [Candidatus Dormibacteraeota bacterium]|nr:serine/threonine-protein kinase [Candidatus Dormibacteraeota bacterium]